MAKETPELFQNMSSESVSDPSQKSLNNSFTKPEIIQKTIFKHSHLMWHSPNKLIRYNAWQQENNKSLGFCNWNIVFLGKQKAVCSKSMAILNVTFQAEPRCFRPCLLVLHGRAACTLWSACAELRTRSAVQPPTAGTKTVTSPQAHDTFDSEFIFGLGSFRNLTPLPNFFTHPHSVI